MNKKEIIRRIKSEKRRIARLKDEMESIRSDMKATATALLFWEKELAKLGEEN